MMSFFLRSGYWPSSHSAAIITLTLIYKSLVLVVRVVNIIKGSKNVFHQNQYRDVGMVPAITLLHRKTNWRKKVRNKEGDAMTFEQPRSTFASFKAHWIRTSPSLHLATF